MSWIQQANGDHLNLAQATRVAAEQVAGQWYAMVYLVGSTTAQAVASYPSKADAQEAARALLHSHPAYP